MDNWTRQFYKNELKEIYKPAPEVKPEKKLLDEIKEDVSLKRIKSGVMGTLKRMFWFFVIFAILGLVIFGGGYVALRYFTS